MNTRSVFLVCEVIAMLIAVSHAYPATLSEDDEQPLDAGVPADLADSFGSLGLTEEDGAEQATLSRQKRGWFKFGLAKGLFLGSALGYGAGTYYTNNGGYRTYNNGSGYRSNDGNGGYVNVNYGING